MLGKKQIKKKKNVVFLFFLDIYITWHIQCNSLCDNGVTTAYWTPK